MHDSSIWFWIYYPGYITLPQNATLFSQMFGKDIAINVRGFLSSLDIKEYGNALVVETIDGKKSIKIKNETTIDNYHLGLLDENDMPNLLIQNAYQPHYRQIRQSINTDIIIGFETNFCEEPHIDDIGFFSKVLEHLIKGYRFLTEDIEIKCPFDLGDDTPAIRYSIIKYTAEEMNLSPKERLLSDRSHSFKYVRIPEINPSKYLEKNPANSSRIAEIIANFLSDKVILPPIHESITKSLEIIETSRDYNYALLEIFISLEVFLWEYTTEALQSKNVSKNKIDDFKKNGSISTIVNIILPAIFSNDLSTEDKVIFDSMNTVRKQRNNIVHYGIKLSKDESFNSIQTIKSFVDILNRIKFAPIIESQGIDIEQVKISDYVINRDVK